jgi:hypothetical protein
LGEDDWEDKEVLGGGTKMRSVVDWRTRFAERKEGSVFVELRFYGSV